MAETKKVEDVVAEALAGLSETHAINGETETEEESSETASTSSSDSSEASENSLDSLLEDEYGEYYPVTCSDNEARFYLNRFARGSIGKCIYFNGQWITPNEFQAISGRKSSKDWKKSIRYKKRCLKELISERKFQEHKRECTCPICIGKSDKVDIRDKESVTIPGNIKPHKRISQEENPITNTNNGLVPVGSKRTHTKRQTNPGTSAHTEQSNKQETANGKDIDVSRTKRPRKAKGQTYRTQLGTFASPPKKWSIEDVGEFLRNQGFSELMESFNDSEVDGQSLLLLRENHLIDNFDMKLGPALRLIDSIKKLNHPS